MYRGIYYQGYRNLGEYRVKKLSELKEGENYLIVRSRTCNDEVVYSLTSNVKLIEIKKSPIYDANLTFEVDGNPLYMDFSERKPTRTESKDKKYIYESFVVPDVDFNWLIRQNLYYIQVRINVSAFGLNSIDVFEVPIFGKDFDDAIKNFEKNQEVSFEIIEESGRKVY